MNSSIIKVSKKVVPHLLVFGVISSLIIFFRLKKDESFIQKWWPFYLVGVFIIAPIAIVIFKAVTILLTKHLKIKNIYINGILFGVLMSGSIGVLLSTALVILSADYNTFVEFTIKWKETVYSFLPRILIIGPLFGGVIKPLIQKRNKKKSVLS